MKKITMLLTLCTILSGNMAFAQQESTMNDKNQDSSMTTKDRNTCPCPPPSCPGCTKDFAWGTAITALAVLGVVVGLTASQAAN
jgi:hypothetical protein